MKFIEILSDKNERKLSIKFVYKLQKAKCMISSKNYNELLLKRQKHYQCITSLFYIFALSVNTFILGIDTYTSHLYALYSAPSPLLCISHITRSISEKLNLRYNHSPCICKGWVSGLPGHIKIWTHRRYLYTKSSICT